MAWKHQRSIVDGDGGAADLWVAPTKPWRAWAVTAGLWILVGLAAAGGVLGLTRQRTAAPVQRSQESAPSVPPEVMGVGEWAVLVAVPAADTSTASVAVTFPAERPNVQSGALRVVSATAVVAEQVDEDYWAVTVAAEVELAEGSPALLYFEVGVIDGPGGAVAVTDPALVPTPAAIAEAIDVAGTLGAPDLSDPRVETVSSFLTAMLTGDPDVGRWTAPRLEIVPAVPAGSFDDVEVVRASVREVDPASVRVRAEVLATTTSEAQIALAYEVEIVSRQDRWEVSALTGAPTLERTGGGAVEPSASSALTSTTFRLAPDDGAANPYLYEEAEN